MKKRIWKERLQKNLAVLVAASVLAGAMPVSTLADNAGLPAEITLVDKQDAVLSRELTEARLQSEQNDSGILPLPESAEIALAEDGSASGTDNYTKLLGEGQLPSAYMSTLEEVSSKYPDTRDQSTNGLCWAYTSMAMSELSMINAGMEGRSADHSELQIAYFTTHSVQDDGGDVMVSDGDTFITGGGNMYYAMFAMANWFGAVSESNVSTTGMMSQVIASGLPDAYASSMDCAHLRNAYIIDPSTSAGRDATKALVKQCGAVGIGFYMSSRYYDAATNSLYTRRRSRDANHAVTIVGWDDDKETRAAEPGAWLVRNSWSTKTAFSEDSYFWIPYNEPSIMEEGYAFEMASAGNYDHNYRYDSLSTCYPYEFYAMDKIGNTVDVEKVCNRAANVFTAASSESLDAVSISSLDAGLGYVVRIYKNPDSEDPETGTLANTTSGVLEYAGVNTIDLSSSVPLSAGDRFAVVVELTSNSSNGFNFEKGKSNAEIGFGSTMASIPRDSTYVYLGGRWYSLYNIVKNADSSRYGVGNVCIKAFTRDRTPDSATPDPVTPEESQDGDSPSDTETGDSVQQGKESSENTNSKSTEKKSTAVAKPAKVGSLKVTGRTKKSITIKWGRTGNTTGYQIYRRKGTYGKWTKVKTIKGASKLTFKNTGLNRKTVYYYKVRAYRKVKGKTYLGKFSSIVKKKTK